MTPMLLLCVAAAAGAAPPVAPGSVGLLSAYPVRGIDTFTVSPDEKRVACFDGWNMKLIDLTSGRVTGKEHGKSGGFPMSVVICDLWMGRFCPDGRLALGLGAETGVRYAASIPTVKIIDLDKDRVVWSSEAHEDSLGTMALSADGRWLATGGGDHDCSVRVWDLTCGRILKCFQFREGDNNGVKEVSFSPSGGLVAVGLDKGQVKVIDTKTWKIVREKKVNPMLHRALFLDDAHLALVWRNPFRDHGTVVWEAVSGSKAKDRLTETGIKLLPSPREPFLVYGLLGGKLRVCDKATGEKWGEVRAHEDTITDLHFSQDGRRLYTAGPDGLKVWSVPILLRAAKASRGARQQALPPDKDAE